MHNHITIYSSGIADIQRGYSIPTGEATKIALLINRDHLGDVLGSLNIYGPVTLVSPPVYAPQNEAAGNLELKGDGVLEDLAVKLRGAKVQLQRAGGTVTGTLLGEQQESEWQERTLLSVKYAIVLTSDGVARIAFRDIQRWQFVDEVVNKELEKALKRQFRTLKPDSTTIDLSLSANTPDAEAVVQYTVPAAAWKISYRLREQEEGKYEFQGFAIVDNHSEEDWNDVMIAVVTGEPITFSTDLAITKVPSRDHVNLVKAKALGAKEVEEAMPEMVMMAAPAAAGGSYADIGASRSRGLAKRAMPAADMSYMMQERASARIADAAEMPAAETREVGDFAIFRAQTPVSIGAHRSALVPIFLVALDHTRSVLYYKQKDHAERGYRALEFTNTTPYSLGRGVCSVYAEDTFMGSCVLPATSPGGDALLVHALETGVRVQAELKDFRSDIVGIKVSEGAAVLRKRSTANTHFQFSSLKDEPFTVVVDHDFRLHKPQATAVVRRTSGETPLEVDSKLKSGVRLRLALAARERLDVVVTETKIDSERIAIVEPKKGQQLNTSWLIDNLIASNGPLAQHAELRAALEIEKRLSAKAEEIAEITQRVMLLNQRQERLRKNIASGGQDEQTARWRVELGEAEVQINLREEQTLPQLRAEEQAIRAELRQALLNLVLEWKE